MPHLALADINEAGIERTAAAARALGVKVIVSRVDVTHADLSRNILRMNSSESWQSTLWEYGYA